MANHSKAFLVNHRVLNQHRKMLELRPDLTSIASPAAQKLMFTSLLDYLASLPPFVGMDSLVDEDLKIFIDIVLDGEPRELCATPLDVLTWMGLPDSSTGRRYSLRMMQYLGCQLDRFGDRANPAHVVGALHEMIPFLPEPSVLEIDFGGEMDRFTPSAPGRRHLSWTGVVCIAAGSYR